MTGFCCIIFQETQNILSNISNYFRTKLGVIQIRKIFRFYQGILLSYAARICPSPRARKKGKRKNYRHLVPPRRSSSDRSNCRSSQRHACTCPVPTRRCGGVPGTKAVANRIITRVFHLRIPRRVDSETTRGDFQFSAFLFKRGRRTVVRGKELRVPQHLHVAAGR
ncbi:hypothetical protein PUN28_011457 [Cardiocondyla obscurior]|uniref:Uncharacterized protein n=1 Tax=Cardiocondyla obscurior TaxID=286306 RepID=A0AAW2FGL6_9HYME